MRVIETLRLRLEPQLANHAAAMFAVLSDPAIYTYEREPPASVEWLHQRYVKLETRRSADGSEQWLNWVLRQADADLLGCVQATVQADGHAFVAYELASAFWGRGLAREAVTAMIDELVAQYRVHTLVAVFKRANIRSRRLLERLDFAAATAEDVQRFKVEADEDLMLRRMAATVSAR